MSESYGEDGFQGKMDFSKGADAVPGEPVGSGLVNSSVLQNGQQWCFRKDTDNFKREDVSLKFIKIMRFFWEMGRNLSFIYKWSYKSLLPGVAVGIQ